ncbi:MAG: hypothetical protein CVU44_00100 [Chloroflexi bacterium HGW-Chloroflexi-6]|nr:MAG: hypothetical protein CVU44_00100 [Chloroflexi bacterium HGW-Chloroflexi-6]
MQFLLTRYKDKFPQVGLAIVLGLVLFVENSAFMFFGTQQIQPSSSSIYLYSISIASILALWVHYDSRSSGISLGMDQAMYIFFGWPITFPIYAFRSRGFRRGGLLLLAFLGITILAVIIAFVITIILNIGIAIISVGK